MPMTVSCPSCKQALRIGEEHQGKAVKCPGCQQVFKAPASPQPEQAAPEAENDPPSPFQDLDRPSDRSSVRCGCVVPAIDERISVSLCRFFRL